MRHHHDELRFPDVDPDGEVASTLLSSRPSDPQRNEDFRKPK
jgi:hypothetical protein